MQASKNSRLRLPLVSAPGIQGRKISLVAAYSGNTRQSVSTWNEDIQAGNIGLGWDLAESQIVRHPQGTGYPDDDLIFLVTGDASNRLLPTGMVGDLGEEYECNGYRFWKIYYQRQHDGEGRLTTDRWLIVRENGMQYVYGGSVTRADGRNYVAENLTVQWGVTWGNWSGTSVQLEGQTQTPIAWNLSQIINIHNEKMTFAYEQVSVAVGGTTESQNVGLNYTQSQRLVEIATDRGYSVKLNYLPLQSSEMPEPVGGKSTQGEVYTWLQRRFHTHYLSQIDEYNQYDKLVNSVILENDTRLNDRGKDNDNPDSDYYKMDKRLLVGIRRVNPAGRSYQPATRLSYFGQDPADGDFDVKRGSANLYCQKTEGLYGALKELISSSGSRTSYRYSEEILDEQHVTWSKKLDLENLSNSKWKYPQVYFGGDYTLLTAVNDDQQMRFWVYQWRGYWENTFSQEITDVKHFHDIEFVVQRDYFVVISRDEHDHSKELNLVYYKNPQDPYDWLPFGKQPKIIDSFATYIAKANNNSFGILVVSRGGGDNIKTVGDLYRYRFNGTIWRDDAEPVEIDHFGHHDNGRVKPVFAMTAYNGYLFVINARNDNSTYPKVRRFHVSPQGEWDEKSMTLQTHFYDKQVYKTTVNGYVSFTGVNTLQVEPGNGYVGLAAFATYEEKLQHSYTDNYHADYSILDWFEDSPAAPAFRFQRMAHGEWPKLYDRQIQVCESTVLIPIEDEQVGSYRQIFRYDGARWVLHQLTHQNLEGAMPLGIDQAISVHNKYLEEKRNLVTYNPQTGDWARQDSVTFPEKIDLAEVIGIVDDTVGFVLQVVGFAAPASALLNAVTFAASYGMYASQFIVPQVLMDSLKYGQLSNSGFRYITAAKENDEDISFYRMNYTGQVKKLGAVDSLKSAYDILTFSQKEVLYGSHAGDSYVQRFRNGTVAEVLKLGGQNSKGDNEVGRRLLAVPGTAVGFNIDEVPDDNVQSDDKHSFINAKTVYLNKIMDDFAINNEQQVVDHVVSQITVDDGYQQKRTLFRYDQHQMAFDTTSFTGLYNLVETAGGNADWDTATNLYGYVANYYYNGRKDLNLSPPDGADSNANEHPALCFGKSYLQQDRWVGPHGDVTAAKRMSYFMAFERSASADPDKKLLWSRKHRSDRYLDGVSKTRRYIHDQVTSGLTKEIETYYVDDAGSQNADASPISPTRERLHTYYTYAWEIDDYKALRDRHILTPKVQKRTVRLNVRLNKGDEVSADALGQVEYSTVRTWNIQELRPESSYRWIGDSAQPPAFTAWSTDTDAGPAWLETGRITRAFEGIPVVTANAEGVMQSTLYDNKHLLQLAHFSNASLETREAYFTSFEPYEDLSGWGASLASHLDPNDSFAGSRCLKLTKGANVSLAAGSPLGRLPGKMVLGAYVKTLKDFTDADAVAIDLVLKNPAGAELLRAGVAVEGTSGQWAYQEAVVDVGRADYLGGVLSLEVSSQADQTVCVDCLRLSPIRSNFDAIIYATDNHLPIAHIGRNGAVSRADFDDLQRPLGTTTKQGQVSSLGVHYFSRDGGADRFNSMAPNASLSTQALDGGRYCRFRAGEPDGWTPADGGNIVEGKIALGKGSTACYPIEPSLSVGLRFQAEFATPPSALLVSFDSKEDVGKDYQLKITVAKASCTLTLDGQNSKEIPIPRDLMFMRAYADDSGQVTLYVYADGQQMFAVTYSDAAHHNQISFSCSDGSVDVSKVFVFNSPSVSMVYADGTGRARQHQAMESGNSIIVSEQLYDVLGRPAFETVPVRKPAQNAPPVASATAIAYEENFVAARNPESTGAGSELWSTDPSDPNRGKMSGLVQEWWQVTSQDDRSYPYHGRYYEANPVSRLTQSTDSAKDYIYDASHADKYRYGLTPLAQQLLSRQGVEANFDDFVVTTVETALSNTERQTTVSIADKMGRHVISGTGTGENPFMSGGEGIISGSSFAYGIDGSRFVTAQLPNYYTDIPDASAFEVSREFDKRGLMTRRDSPDVGETRFVHDPMGRVRFRQDAAGAASGYFIYWNYDRLGRPTEAGVISGQAWDRPELQAAAFLSPGQLEQGLIAHWDLDQTQGQTVVDRSGNGINGKVAGPSVWSCDSPNGLTRSLSFFTAEKNCVSFDDPGPLNELAGNVTVSVWVKVLIHTPTLMTVIKASYDANGGNSEFHLRIEDWKTYRFGWYDAEREAFHGVTAPIDPEDRGRWIHLTGVFDGRQWQLYKNAARVAIQSDPSGPPAGARTWTLGAGAGGVSANFNGSLSDQRIYDRALSAAEIMGLYLNGRAFPKKRYFYDTKVAATDLPDSAWFSSLIEAQNSFVESNARGRLVLGLARNLDPDTGNPDSLVGRWSLSEGPNAKQVVSNVGKSVITGAVKGDVSWENNRPGEDGYAPAFPGKIGSVIALDADTIISGLLSSHEFTLSAWIRLAQLNKRQQIVSLGASKAQRGYWFFVNDKNQLQFDLSNISGPSSDVTLAADVWTHVAVTCTINRVELFVNGRSACKPQVMAADLAAGDAIIGGPLTGYGEYEFNGNIADVRIYKKALDGPTLRRIRLASLPARIDTSLVATGYRYDADGQVVSVMEAVHDSNQPPQLTHYAYNSAGDMVNVVYPAASKPKT